MTRCAERLTPRAAHHGEGPFWDRRSGRLLFMDVLAGVVGAIESTGKVLRYDVPADVATVIRRRASGGFVIATGHDLMCADDDLANFTHLTHVASDPHVRTNDGGCDPTGGFVIGTMAYDERTGGGAVYRVAPDCHATTLLAPVSISNGIQWSADGTRVFYIDTPTRRIDVFDVDLDTGRWSNRRVHIDMNNSIGYPDGMAIDVDQGLWVAMWGGGAVNHYDAFGQLVETIEVPGVTQVSSCAFGGGSLDELFITTSRQGLPNDSEPSAGAIFSTKTTTRGAALLEFAG
uniref:Gluconolactonase n=1 Tax=Mycolicibacterium gilvum (strain PYR-GCK) TaxID=350054 RepID=A4TF53_MYCGI|nr:gluconolactonase [Mycolicibacterium gilvum PYR-GCK]